MAKNFNVSEEAFAYLNEWLVGNDMVGSSDLIPTTFRAGELNIPSENRYVRAKFIVTEHESIKEKAPTPDASKDAQLKRDS